MSKVLQVEGSLHYDEEESSDSEDETGQSNDPPLVFDSDGSDEEELEIFQDVKQGGLPLKHAAPTSRNPPPDTTKVEVTPPKNQEEASPLSLLSAMATAVQAIEDEYKIPETETSDDMDFSRQDAILQREEALKKKAMQNGEMRSGQSGETFDCSNRNDNNTESSDTFGIAYKPFMPKKNSYELPKGPAFEDEVEFERELQKSSIVAATTLSAVMSGSGTQQNANVSDDEFDFEEVDVSAPRVPIKLPEFNADNSTMDSTSVDDNMDFKATTHATPDDEQDEDNAVEEESFRESSKKALAEIKEVYSSGLGDHEIVLLKAEEETEKNDSLRHSAVLLDMMQGGSVIEEIDEEEFERQEEEAEHLEQEKISNEIKKLEDLQSQWDNVGVENTPSHGLAHHDDASDGSEFKVVNYSQAEAYFRNLDLSPHRNIITIDDDDASTWSLLSKSSKLSKASIPKAEIELPFLIAQVEYSPVEHPEHLNFLRNIYKTLVRNMPTLPALTGGHWDLIGFQGLDPSSDLNRSMKMLTILQVIHMLEKESSISHSLYSNSLGTSGIIQGGAGKPMDTSWPFMCVAIGMTKNSIDALRAGVLTKYAVRFGSALEALHEYHHACFYCFLRSLTANPHVHHAEHLNAIRKEVSSNPLGLLRAFRKSKEANGTGAKKSNKGGDKRADSETSSMYDVSNEGAGGQEGGDGDGGREGTSRKRASWKQMFKKKDEKAKMFMADAT